METLKNIVGRTEKEQKSFDNQQIKSGSLWGQISVLHFFCFGETIHPNKSNAIIRGIYLPD